MADFTMTLDDLEGLKEPMGTPCSCGGGSTRHASVHVWSTPTRWAARVDDHYQSDSGIWWCARGTTRYYRTEPLARAAAPALSREPNNDTQESGHE